MQLTKLMQSTMSVISKGDPSLNAAVLRAACSAHGPQTCTSPTNLSSKDGDRHKPFRMGACSVQAQHQRGHHQLDKQFLKRESNELCCVAAQIGASRMLQLRLQGPSIALRRRSTERRGRECLNRPLGRAHSLPSCLLPLQGRMPPADRGCGLHSFFLPPAWEVGALGGNHRALHRLPRLIAIDHQPAVSRAQARGGPPGARPTQQPEALSPSSPRRRGGRLSSHGGHQARGLVHLPGGLRQSAGDR